MGFEPTALDPPSAEGHTALLWKFSWGSLQKSSLLLKYHRAYSVGDILRPLEGDLAPVECATDGGYCEHSCDCVTVELWSTCWAISTISRRAYRPFVEIFMGVPPKKFTQETYYYKDMGLSEATMKALDKKGFTQATPIQGGAQTAPARPGPRGLQSAPGIYR